jgi:uncharacterized protein YjbJ (UPF0337 family)
LGAGLPKVGRTADERSHRIPEIALVESFRTKKRRKLMKPSTKDQIKGALHETKGKVKEKAGQLTGNPNLAAEGKNEKLTGKVQKKVGQIEKVFEK